MTCWLNGALLPRGEAAIDPDDRGFTLGDGLFETVRIAGGQPAHLPRHLRRLRDGAALLGIPLPWDDEALGAAFAATIAAVAVADGSARLTLSRGPAARGVLPPETCRPTVLITAANAGPSPAGPVHAVLCTTTRRNEWSPLSRIKSLSYLDAVLARIEADRRGAGDALLLNTQGRLAEASAANLLVLRSGRLLTPAVADGALPGIRRALLIERCGAAEASLPPEALQEAEAVFLSSSLGLREVASLDGRALPRRDDLLAELDRRTR